MNSICTFWRWDMLARKGKLFLSRLSTRFCGCSGSSRSRRSINRILLRLGLIMQSDSEFSSELPIMKRCGITPIDVWPRFSLLWGSGKSIGCSWLKLESGNGHFGGCWVVPNGSTDCRAVSHYWVQPISENECSKSDGWMKKSEEKKAVTGSATYPDAGRHLLRYQCEFDTVSCSPKSKTSLFHSAYGSKGPTIRYSSG